MVQQMQSVCRECNGEGEILNEKDRCKECNGKKTIKEKKTLEVPVDKGMHDGQKITFRGESNQDVSHILSHSPSCSFEKSTFSIFFTFFNPIFSSFRDFPKIYLKLVRVQFHLLYINSSKHLNIDHLTIFEPIYLCFYRKINSEKLFV